ncbi:MAG: IS701 family transposase [Caldilineaceae bacterium]
MELRELNEWANEFEAFQSRFAPLFGRRETREQAAKYLHGLMSPVERKNSWQLAEAVGDKTPDATQRLLYSSKWDADAARDELQSFVIEQFGDAEGIGVVDETGFLKKGEKSAGVQRQYSGTAGKTENCQLGVFLTYATAHGHTFLDRRLYLPESWCADAERCAEAKIPADTVFETKPEQAVQMLQHAWAMGVPMRWVTGDEVYGEASYLRDAVAQSGRWYVLAVRANSTVWLERPEVAVPTWRGIGRKPVKERVIDSDVQPVPIPALVASWPENRWQRLAVAEGEKGPRLYDWACQRLVESQDHLPGRDAWLLVRRSPAEPDETAFYLSNAPAETDLLTLAQVASTRYTVEQSIEEAKGETGLDHYEVRYWHSWYRHITLSMMAHAWLASVRLRRNREKGGLNPFWPN